MIGGSLGGLTAALLLRDCGHEVTIFERSAAQLEQRGAGIGFLPETYRYLVERAGVDLDTISITTEHIRHLDRTASVIHDRKHTYRFSSWNTVYRELLRCFGLDRYWLGHEVEAVEQTATKASLRISGQAQFDADLVVCADGVSSRFRSVLIPGLEPNYAGYVAWRGMVPEAELAKATSDRLIDAITYVVTANSHILVYPIPGIDGSVQPGERLINFVWYRNYLAGPELQDLLLGKDGRQRDVSLPPGMVRDEHAAEMTAVAVARLPAPVADVVAQTAEPFVQVVFDAEVPNMAFGRICLIGDAACVARPHAAAGTAKAADDAWALADSLKKHNDDVVAALSEFEARQLEVGRQLVARTRRIGAASQFEMTWDPAGTGHIFGLHGPGR